MASSFVHAEVFAAVLANITAVSTSVVVFDMAVADLTPLLADPVEVLFVTQLGGATDINRALAYCQGPVTRPQDDFRADQRPLRRRQQCRDAGARGGAGWGAACR
jgi:hypothetical protein